MTRDALERLLASWLTDRRWYAGKGSGVPTVELVGSARLAAPGPVVPMLHLVRAGAVYQVPLTYRPAPDPELEAALLGTVTVDLGDGERAHWVYDGPFDAVYVRAMLRLLARGGTVAGTGTRADAVELVGHVQPAGPVLDEAAQATVLSGEQSNTSLIVGADTPSAVIVKLFRLLAPGDNPDIVVQSALAAAGCLRVPQPAGWLAGSWPDPHAPQGRACGHLAFASEFLGGSEDAWRVATRAVASGASFAGPARDLGVATAEVHETLAETLPTVPVTPSLLDALADVLLDRLDGAVAVVPALTEHATRARAVLDGVRRLATVDDLQRVHGDYHLGQVLHSPGRGWVLLDFEGEPLRPLAERSEPDLALRDVAGMLRSFDYAAAFVTAGRAEDDPAVLTARSWAHTAREAFLAGYGARLGLDLTNPNTSTLLRALELDKALYEAVYETQNRPGWVAIPMSAVHRLLEPPA